MCLPQSPMIFNGINDVIGINGGNGNIGDPLVQMVYHVCHWFHCCQWCQWHHWEHWLLVIHQYKWGFIGVIAADGANDSRGVIDFNVQWGMWNIGDPLVQMVISMCAIGLIAANGVNSAIGNIGCWWSINANGNFLASMNPVESLISMCNGVCEMWHIAIQWCHWCHWNYFHHWLHWNHCRHWRYCRHCHHCMTNVSSLSPMYCNCRHCHQLSLDILTFTSPWNGTTGAI